MAKVNLNHLISVLEEVPKEYWQKISGIRGRHESYQGFSTEIDRTKIDLPPYRDVPGIYTIQLKYITELDYEGGCQYLLKLELWRKGRLAFSADGDFKEDPITAIYEKLSNPFKEAVADLPSALQTGESVSLSETISNRTNLKHK